MSEKLDRQIACVEREIAMRLRVYPSWIGQKRMTQDKADTEIATMQGVLATLQFLKALETLIRSTIAMAKEEAGPVLDVFGLKVGDVAVRALEDR